MLGIVVSLSGLIIIPPISKKIKIILVVALLVVGFAFETPSAETDSYSERQVAESTQENTTSYQWLTEEGTLLREVEEVVVDQIGEQNNMDEDTVISIRTESDELWINYHASENFTSNMTRGGIKSDMVDVFSNLENDILDEFYDITIVAQRPFVSPEGHESMVNVMIVTLTTEKINEINWSNFLRDNLEVVSSSYYVHPAIR